MSGSNDHPLPTEIKQRMKLYILGKHHSTVITMNKNLLESVDKECMVTPSKTFGEKDTVVPPASVSENNLANESFTLKEVDDDHLENTEGDSPVLQKFSFLML
ncbi:unnamed protein product [Bemisia tabaci]|uniref:Uncharacterized protein n=1 Tax=Bemisia tabaci TaxID=7038 RepID=A0A9P0A9V4_BEMTA|nr:unnamed protein product [Bemisia tabaci]